MRSSKYKPDWNKAFDHILIHTGAALVIHSVSAALGLQKPASGPSLETLHRFWNLAASSTLYILGNIEAKVRLLQYGRGLRICCVKLVTYSTDDLMMLQAGLLSHRVGREDCHVSDACEIQAYCQFNAIDCLVCDAASQVMFNRQ